MLSLTPRRFSLCTAWNKYALFSQLFWDFLFHPLFSAVAFSSSYRVTWFISWFLNHLAISPFFAVYVTLLSALYSVFLFFLWLPWLRRKCLNIPLQIFADAENKRFRLRSVSSGARLSFRNLHVIFLMLCFFSVWASWMQNNSETEEYLMKAFAMLKIGEVG